VVKEIRGIIIIFFNLIIYCGLLFKLGGVLDYSSVIGTNYKISS